MHSLFSLKRTRQKPQRSRQDRDLTFTDTIFTFFPLSGKMHLFYVSGQNSSGVEQLTRNEQVKGSIPFFGSDGSFGNRFFLPAYRKPGPKPGNQYK